MSILKPKATTTRTLSVRLPADLLTQIEQTRAAADAAGFTFDVPAIVSDSLARAVRQAAAELAQNQASSSQPA